MQERYKSIYRKNTRNFSRGTMGNKEWIKQDRHKRDFLTSTHVKYYKKLKGI